MTISLRSIAPCLLLLSVASGSSRAIAGPPSTAHDASATETVSIDASRPFRPAGPARYDLGAFRSPSGDTLGLTSRYLTRNGQPWLPVMGEFHFSRYPNARWEEEILKMKASGVTVIATYVIWIHHEEMEGEFDWSGQRDLRAFAQLCAKHGMYLWVRVGPWAHGEARNGGFPDWLVRRGSMRRNDPFYLESVGAWYREIGRQLNGLLWKDGGSIIGVQLENEYSARGECAGEAHILMLKKMVRDAGLDVPYYTVTAWDNAVVPERAVLPVYDGYPDAPWDAGLKAWPAPEVYAFRTRTRVAANLPADNTLDAPVPFLTAEMGGGNEVTYHRRPVIGPDDVAAMLPVMVGSGVNLYGTYMYQGGENPDGKRTTLEESQATGYPNDVPVKSYDFEAPLGEFGEERASLRKLKVFQYFLGDFGVDLAPMTVSYPARLPRDPADLVPLRASVRSSGDQGYLFVNNYVRNAAMPAHPGVQFELHLPGGTLTLPSQPIDIPAGAYFIWPFNLHASGVTIRYATAQMFTRLPGASGETLFFEALPGVPAEIVLDAATARVEHAPSSFTTEDGLVRLRNIEPGSAIDLTASSGAHLRIIVLSQQDAENAWRVQFAGESRLLVTPQDVYFNANTPACIHLQSTGSPRFAFSLIPAPPSTPRGSLPINKLAGSNFAARFEAESAPVDWAVAYSQNASAPLVPPVRMGPPRPGAGERVAQAPAGSAFQNAAKWTITIPAGSSAGLSELLLRVHYSGDVARLYHAGSLLTDNFYNGQRWDIGLTRFLDLSATNHLELDILPLRYDAPIYIENPHRSSAPDSGQLLHVDSVELVPQYQLILNAQ